MAREGYDLALVGHEEQALQTLTAELEELGASVSHAVADVTDVEAATDAVRRLAEGFGRVDWLHFNPSAFRQKDPLSLTAAELLTDVGLGVAALLTALQAVRPFLQPGCPGHRDRQHGRRQALERGSLPRRAEGGLRNLVRSIDTTLEPLGARAVSLTVRGTLGKEGPFTPDRVADAIWDAAHQDESDWHTEVPYRG